MADASQQQRRRDPSSAAASSRNETCSSSSSAEEESSKLQREGLALASRRRQDTGDFSAAAAAQHELFLVGGSAGRGVRLQQRSEAGLDVGNEVFGSWQWRSRVNARLRQLTNEGVIRYERRSRRRRARGRKRRRAVAVGGGLLAWVFCFYAICVGVMHLTQLGLRGAGAVARHWFAAELARARVCDRRREARSAGRRARRAHNRMTRAMHGNTRPPDDAGDVSSTAPGFAFNPGAAPFVPAGIVAEGGQSAGSTAFRVAAWNTERLVARLAEGGSRDAKRAAWRVVVDGLELQALVDESAKGFSAGVKRRVQARGKLAVHLREWRLVVVRGGPARAAALARVSTARAAVEEATCLTVVPGVGSVWPLVQSATAWWTPLALADTAADAPVTAWWLRLWLLRLASRAASARLRMFAGRAPLLRALLRRWARRVPADAPLRPANTLFGVRATVGMALIGQAAIGVGVAVPWEEGGTEGRRRRDEGGVWRAISFGDGLAHTWRAWTAAGGQKAMWRERGRRREVDETRRAARLNDWMEECGVRVPPALAALANARRLLRQRPVARRRMLANAEIGCGLAPDGRGRWAVESVMDWRGGSGGREALIRWCGFDPTTGEPWEDLWEPKAALTADLRAGGIIRRRRTRVQMAEAERAAQEDWDERHSRARRSRRLQGEDPEEECRCHVSSEGEGMEVVVGEHFRPLSCVVMCAGAFGGWYLVSDVVPYGGLTVTVI